MESAEASGQATVMPCFPLPLTHSALPGTERTLHISEPRYVKMYGDLLASGQSCFLVPRWEDSAEGARLAEAAVVFRLIELKDAPPRARYRYTCSHTVAAPMRITRVLNPADFGDRSTYLRVECEEASDPDSGLSLVEEEEALLEALGQVVELRERAGDALRRFQLRHDGMGRPWIVDNHLLPTVTEEELRSASADEDGFWHLAVLWQGYCERRVVSLWQAHDRARSADTPERTAELQKAYASDAKALERDTADLMQRLLQTASRGQRLAGLRAAAQAEACRLAATAALQGAVGAGPLA